MVGTIKVLVVFSLFTFLILGEAISPIEAQAQLSSLDANGAFFTPNYSQPETIYVTITGYSPSPDETDSTPRITASNTVVRPGIVASNSLRMGTKVKLPTLFGEETFVVEDRMNARYSTRLDVFFEQKEEARAFGIHYNVPIEIIETPTQR